MSSPEPTPRPNARLISDFSEDADMQDIVREFVSEMPRRIEALQQSWSGRQTADLKRLAHQLRGAAGGYGFPSITERAGDLEDRLRSLDPTNLPALEKLHDEFESLIDLCRRASAA